MKEAKLPHGGDPHHTLPWHRDETQPLVIKDAEGCVVCVSAHPHDAAHILYTANNFTTLRCRLEEAYKKLSAVESGPDKRAIDWDEVKKQLPRRLATAFSAGIIDDRQRLIMDLRFGLGRNNLPSWKQPRSLKEVAEIVGISPTRIRQIEMDTLTALGLILVPGWMYFATPDSGYLEADGGGRLIEVSEEVMRELSDDEVLTPDPLGTIREILRGALEPKSDQP